MDKEAHQEKKYFSISEVSEICDIKSHTLRFWEKEFKELKPITRKGNRRYYQNQDIELIKRIYSLLYLDGMTIEGAKKNLKSSIKTPKTDTKVNYVLDDLKDLLSKIK